MGSELYSFEGKYYTVDTARIYTLPSETIEVPIAAGGPEAAELAAELGDGPDQHGPRRGARRAVPEERWRRLKIRSAHRLLGEQQARGAQDCARVVPNGGLRGPLSQELPLPSHFEEAAQMVAEEDIAEAVVCGSDVDAHLEAVEKFADAGFDHVYVHQVGPDQAGFVDFYASKVVPQARKFMPSRRARAAA